MSNFESNWTRVFGKEQQPVAKPTNVRSASEKKAVATKDWTEADLPDWLRLVQVRLFEAISGCYLSLAEWRIALVLGTDSLEEKAAGLRRALASVEARVQQNLERSNGLCKATQEATASLRKLIVASAPDPVAVSNAAKRMCAVLDALAQQAPHETDEEIRARAAVLRARVDTEDRQESLGIR